MNVQVFREWFNISIRGQGHMYWVFFSLLKISHQQNSVVYSFVIKLYPPFVSLFFKVKAKVKLEAQESHCQLCSNVCLLQIMFFFSFFQNFVMGLILTFYWSSSYCDLKKIEWCLLGKFFKKTPCYGNYLHLLTQSIHIA